MNPDIGKKYVLQIQIHLEFGKQWLEKSWFSQKLIQWIAIWTIFIAPKFHLPSHLYHCCFLNVKKLNKFGSRIFMTPYLITNSPLSEVLTLLIMNVKSSPTDLFMYLTLCLNSVLFWCLDRTFFDLINSFQKSTVLQLPGHSARCWRNNSRAELCTLTLSC